MNFQHAFRVSITGLVILSCVVLGLADNKRSRGVIKSVSAKGFTLQTDTGEITLSSDDLFLGEQAIKTGNAVEVLYDDAKQLALAVRPDKSPGAAPPVTDEETPEMPTDDAMNSAASPAGDWLLDDAKGRVFEAIVTGAGLNEDAAKINAYEAAVEQMVGVLVDAEALVEGDELVRDEVLTYSEGDLEDFKPIKQWTEEGLTFIRAKATVRVENVAARLAKRRVHVLPLDGRQFFDVSSQVAIDASNRAKVLREMVLNDFGMDQMLQAVIVEKPQVISQDKHFAAMKVVVRTEPRMDKWEAFRGRVVDWILASGDVTKYKQTTVATASKYRETDFYTLGFDLETKKKIYEIQGKGAHYGHWIFLIKASRAEGAPGKVLMQWEGYPSYPEIGEVFSQMKNKDYRIRVMLIDANNRVLAESTRPLVHERSVMRSLYMLRDDGWKMDLYFLGPFAWIWDDYLSPSFAQEAFEINIAHQDLKNVTQAAAVIEEINP